MLWLSFRSNETYKNNVHEQGISDCNFPFFPERLSRDKFLSFPGKPVPSRCPVKIFEKGQTTDIYGQN